ncbi:family 43 glycosylhydrolase [Actinacidiphila sp. bgisy144]|jgi:hypothetical protein|uniref:family 43 glycosylhydrolase n=1 Tax=Actinacidiphila sp. bgisy144 TaxID=3413791 RepID=UPI003EBC061B
MTPGDPPPLNGSGLTGSTGLPVHAHGGGILEHDSAYYWFGEDRHPDRTFRSVEVHRSTDLVRWEPLGAALTQRSHPHLARANLERPKVLHDRTTGRFVMWAHKEEAGNYRQARAAVAVADRPQGPYRYFGDFRPLGHMSRDLTLFQDTDGTGYLLSAANDNADLHVYRLTEDLTAPAELVAVLWPGAYREAPALFRHEGRYVLLTSGCSGWAPNQQRYAVAEAPAGPWGSLHDLGDRTCYGSQTACVVSWPPAADGGPRQHVYVGDRWGPHRGAPVNDSGYVWLPLVFAPDFAVAPLDEAAVALPWQPRMWSP